MQIGLHSNHTRVFLGKNKMECPLILITGQAAYFPPLPDCHMFIYLFLDFAPLTELSLLTKFQTVVLTAWVF